MWYLLAEKATAPVLEQIAEGKKTVRQTMSAEQLAEAESKAALWLKNAKKQTSFAAAAKRLMATITITRCTPAHGNSSTPR